MKTNYCKIALAVSLAALGLAVLCFWRGWLNATPKAQVPGVIDWEGALLSVPSNWEITTVGNRADLDRKNDAETHLTMKLLATEIDARTEGSDNVLKTAAKLLPRNSRSAVLTSTSSGCVHVYSTYWSKGSRVYRCTISGVIFLIRGALKYTLTFLMQTKASRDFQYLCGASAEAFFIVDNVRQEISLERNAQ
jgi:hypothetical protein